jgi:C5a peptidase
MRKFASFCLSGILVLCLALPALAGPPAKKAPKKKPAPAKRAAVTGTITNLNAQASTITVDPQAGGQAQIQQQEKAEPKKALEIKVTEKTKIIERKKPAAKTPKGKPPEEARPGQEEEKVCPLSQLAVGQLVRVVYREAPVPKKERPRAEKPKKEKPEKQSPQKQKPEKQKPEKQEPEKQQPEKQQPEKQEPEKQEPEKQEPEKQEPEKQEPEKQEAEKEKEEVETESAQKVARAKGEPAAPQKQEKVVLVALSIRILKPAPAPEKDQQ